MTRESQATLIPYLSVHDGVNALEFYKKAFGAVEIERYEMEDGKLGHAEIQIGGAPIYLADEYPAGGFLSAKTVGNTPVTLMLSVANVDALFDQAVKAGATVARPLADQMHGRTGKLIDPFGHHWTLAAARTEVKE